MRETHMMTRALAFFSRDGLTVAAVRLRLLALGTRARPNREADAPKYKCADYKYIYCRHLSVHHARKRLAGLDKPPAQAPGAGHFRVVHQDMWPAPEMP